MLDEARLKRAFDDRPGADEAGGDIARLDDAADELVGRPIIEQEGRIGSGRRLDRPYLRCALPEHGKVVGIEPLDRCRIGDDGGDRLAGEAYPVSGEHRLVAKLGRDAEDVLAGDVIGGQHPDEARVAVLERRQIADDEMGGNVAASG